MPFSTTHPALARALAQRQYIEATAVQAAVQDAAAEGRDLLVSAQTGSGKTVAYGLALATTLLGENERFARAAEPLALVVAPTRELALQVHRELEWLYAEAGGRVVSCVGGMDVRREARALADGAHIVVGTPGRLRDHLERGRLDTSAMRAVVLDEADEMLDLGFREDLTFILDATPAERRTLLFSATLAREIVSLARQYQRDAYRIDTIVQSRPHEDIEYRAIRTAPNDVEHAVVNVLRLFDYRSSLVFCTTREAVRRLYGSLLERGFAAVALSGELSQSERTLALQSLRDGRASICVATDVAARGLDLPDLGLVVHADLPNDPETLLHRSGRTGRAGRKGICVLIVPHTRRRKAESLLASARVQATWGPPPTADEIRTHDQERLVADPVLTEASTDEDLLLARALLAEHSAENIAAALIRMHRSRLPAPEDILDDGGSERGRSPRELRGERQKADRPGSDRQTFERPSFDRAGPPGDGPSRRSQGEMVRFRMSVGRNNNADPRWLLPMICRLGHVTKGEVGAIRIYDRDTMFEIAKPHAERFMTAVQQNPDAEIRIQHDDGTTMAGSEGSAPRAVRRMTRRDDSPAPSPKRRREADTSRDADVPAWTPSTDAVRLEADAPAAPRSDDRPARPARTEDGPRPARKRDKPAWTARDRAPDSPREDAAPAPAKPWRDKPRAASGDADGRGDSRAPDRDVPAKGPSDKPRREASFDDRPRSPRPAGKSFGDKPAGGKPYAGKPYAGKPYAGKPSGGKPAGKSFGSKSFDGKSFGGKPYAGKPAGQKVSADRPAGEKPWRAKPGDAAGASARPGKPFRKDGPAGAGGPSRGDKPRAAPGKAPRSPGFNPHDPSSRPPRKPRSS